MDYPLIFTLQFRLSGNGFLAEVNLSCSALLERDQDDEEWWFLGVKPGALVASGATWNEAYLNFQQTLIRCLIDSAALTDSYEAFETDVASVMGQVHEEELRRWEQARERLRSGESIADADLQALPRVSGAVAAGVSIRRLDTGGHHFSPSENVAPELPQLTTAA